MSWKDISTDEICPVCGLTKQFCEEISEGEECEPAEPDDYMLDDF